MKRLGYLGAVLLVAGAAWAGSSFSVAPKEMKSGDTKTFDDGDQKISVSRNGDDLTVKIEGAGDTKKITVSKGNDGTIRIERGDVLGAPGFRSFVLGPDSKERKRIIIDGVPVVPEFGEHFRTLPPLREREAQTWFVCPKDKTMMAIPDAKEDQTYKCPVDGTVLEKKKGHGFSFFLDEDTFESDGV